MPTYHYKAFTEHGKTVQGFFNADSERLVRKIIFDQGLSCFYIKKSTDFTNSKIKVSSKTVMLFTKQLSNLLRSNIAIDDAIKLAANQVSDSKFKKLLFDLCEKVQQGQRLATVMGIFKSVFSETYVSLVRIGDESGKLDLVFSNLAYYLEERLKIRQKVISALIYPLILFGFSIFIILVLVKVVMPIVVTRFINSDVALPFLTRQLLFFSDNFLAICMFIFFISICSIGCYKQLIKTKKIHYLIHSQLLKMPIIGRFIIHSEIEHFSSCLYLMLSSSMTLTIALHECSLVFSNEYFRQTVSRISLDMNEGKDLAQLLDNREFFPDTFVQLVVSGYYSGTLVESLKSVSDYMKSDLENRRAMILSLIEPVIIVLMGIVTLLIVLAILLPILKMNTLILD